MLQVSNLGKRFGDFWAIRHLSFQVAPGEVLALLGPNGSGKTTTIRMLAGLLMPSEGQAIVGGYDVTRHPQQVRAVVGVLTEQHGLYTRMTGEEYLRFFGRLYGLEDALLEKRIVHWLDFFGLHPYRKRRIGLYSKGMRQKLALARALLHEPRVLLLDEPTSAMDPESTLRVREAIAALRSKERSIVLCTHNLDEAARLADRILILRAGQPIIQGTLSELEQRLLGPPEYEIRLAQPLNGAFSAWPNGVEIVAQTETTVRYRVHGDPQQINPALIRVLSAQGWPIVEVRSQSRSLEQVYLEVVRAA